MDLSGSPAAYVASVERRLGLLRFEDFSTGTLVFHLFT